MHVITCASRLGNGGLGQHFAQLVRDAVQEGEPVWYFCTGSDDAPSATVDVIDLSYLKPVFDYTPMRYSLKWKDDVNSARFDSAVANKLRGRINSFTGFVGKSLRSFKAARSLGCKELRLVAANSHVENVRMLHDRAHSDFGFSDSWLSDRQLARTLEEYKMADTIVVHSEYVRKSFIDRGCDPHKLERMHMEIDPRFVPAARDCKGKPFVVAYAGRVDSTKGIPRLIDAFKKLDNKNAVLRMVGGWSNRRMKKYMQDAMAADRRIVVKPGDPLPVMQDANVFVHPTYEDGFAYAPAEALACGIPVIVTEDTGMKELIEDGVTGHIVPTGSTDAIYRLLQKYLRQHLLQGGH